MEGNDPARLRERQSEAYEREDFPAYFALSERLAAVSPGYARSFECWTQTVLHTLARDAPDLRFLQVGGMDGKRYDPIYAFAKHYAWRGLVLEPLPDLFEALAANYADCPNVTPVNAALTEADGERDMVRVTRDAVREGAVPLWAEGLGTFHPERNALGGVGTGPDLHATLQKHMRREPVRCMTLRSLADSHDLMRVDLLHVDAEGSELTILRQVDAEGFRPRVVHLEYWALPPHERGQVIGLLAERGYRLRMSESDALAVAPDLAAAIEAEAGWGC